MYCWVSLEVIVASVGVIVIELRFPTVTETVVEPLIDDGDRTYDSVRWSSDNAAVFTVSHSGLVTANHAGTASVKATSATFRTAVLNGWGQRCDGDGFQSGIDKEALAIAQNNHE